jgi:hypothetical protein
MVNVKFFYQETAQGLYVCVEVCYEGFSISFHTYDFMENLCQLVWFPEDICYTKFDEKFWDLDLELL